MVGGAGGVLLTRRIACFAMSDRDHFGGLLLVITELVQAGGEVSVWTDRKFKAEVEAAGAAFADLFDGLSLDEVDDRSRPLPSRSVTFAAARAKDMAAAVAAWGAELVVYDSFALIGELVARQLQLPWIPVSAGHAIKGPDYRARLAVDPRVDIDERCWQAVGRLQEEFGLVNASPFSYVYDPSPWLNVSLEPREWLRSSERQWFEPVVFFGSLRRHLLEEDVRREIGSQTKIYAGFGTIVWRYWTAEAAAIFVTLAEAVATLPDVSLTIGLGGADLPAASIDSLRRHGAKVLSFADQWRELRSADLFVTHQGAGSTHEAVAALVPMLSLPFFWDQPALARRCEELGLAVRLGSQPGPQARPSVGDIRQGILTVLAERTRMQQRLLEARQWEEYAVSDRRRLAAQILSVRRSPSTT